MRKVWLTLALIVATGGILAGALGPGAGRRRPAVAIVWMLWAAVGYLDSAQATRERRRHCRPAHRAPVGSGVLPCSRPVSQFRVTRQAAWFELGDSIFGVLPWLAIVWLLLVFPSGAYPTKSERTTGWVLVAFGALTSIAFAVDPAQMEDTGLPSPLAVAGLGDVASVLTGDGGFIILVAFLLMLWC